MAGKKSSVLKWIKCIAVLLCVLLMSGIFLTVMNALLEVTPEERLNRAISEIYGRNIKVTEQVLEEEQKTPIKNATIKLAYLDEEGSYLVKAAGKGGFGGDVTCWVLVVVKDGAVNGVSKVSIINSESQGETLLSNINFLDKYKDKAYEAGYLYSTDDGFTVSGATLSSNAINNAVNGAVAYVNMKLGNAVAEDPYKDWLYTDYIDTQKLTYSFADDVATFNITTLQANGIVPNPYSLVIKVATDGKITEFTLVKSGAFEYDKNYPELEIGEGYGAYLVGKTAADIKALFGESDEDIQWRSLKGKTDGDLVFSGATQSNFIVLYAALFATSNVANAVKTGYSYVEYIDTAKTNATVEDGVVTFNITTLQENGIVPNPYTLAIKVDGEGKITEFTLVKSGAFEYDKNYPELEIGEGYGTYLVGKTAADIKALFGESDEDIQWRSLKGKTDGDVVFSGATQSNFIVLYAALYATSNYGIELILGGNS